MKFATFAAAAENADRAAFQHWFLNDYATMFAKRSFGLVSSIVRLSEPVDAPDANVDPAHLPYHALMETWFVTAEDFRRAARAAEPVLRAHGARFVSYRVTPLLEIDPRFAEAGAGGARPAMTFITPVTWLPDLPRSEARRHWDEHVSTALRVHVGLTKYERNWVDEVMSWSAGAVPVDAYADFSFATKHDFQERFFPGEEDRLEIMQDIANFIKTASTMSLDDPHPIYGLAGQRPR